MYANGVNLNTEKQCLIKHKKIHRKVISQKVLILISGLCLNCIIARATANSAYMEAP